MKKRKKTEANNGYLSMPPYVGTAGSQIVVGNGKDKIDNVLEN